MGYLLRRTVTSLTEQSKIITRKSDGIYCQMSCLYDKVAAGEGAMIGIKTKMPSDDRLLHKTLTYKVKI